MTTTIKPEVLATGIIDVDMIDAAQFQSLSNDTVWIREPVTPKGAIAVNPDYLGLSPDALN